MSKAGFASGARSIRTATLDPVTSTVASSPYSAAMWTASLSISPA
ncbi:MAG TPA: hypothetical protein VH951_07625 [Dehalococcoidia bacterium]